MKVTVKPRTRPVFIIAATALLSGLIGFYVGFGQGSKVMAKLAVQNAASDTLGEIRRLTAALKLADPNGYRRQLAIDLRIDLFKLDELSAATPRFRCGDSQRASLAEASTYIAGNPDPRIFNGSPELTRGLAYCQASPAPP